jgi:hypothetical protein
MRFRSDTPSEILGAFEGWRVPESAPELPPLEQSLSAEDLSKLERFFGDLVEEERFLQRPPLHQAYGWRWWSSWPETAYLPGAASVQMRWAVHGEYWTLTMRSYPKETSEDACMIFGPLGQFADFNAEAGVPQLVGYVRHESEVRPTLIWNVGASRFVFEDLRRMPLPRELRVDAPLASPMSPEQQAEFYADMDRIRGQLGD